MEKIILELKRREEEEKIKSLEYFSQVFKRQRKKFNMTLEQASDGICSISYLSKLENSLVEKIEESFLKKLCERVNLDYKEIHDFKDDNQLDDVAYDFFSGNYDRIEKLYLSMNDNLESAKSDIVRGFYYLVTKKYGELQEVLNLIYELSSSLQPIESFMYVILSNELDISRFQIKKCLRSFDQFASIPCRFKHVKWLIEYQGLRLYYHCNDYIMFNKYYNILTSYDDITFPYENMLIAKLMKIQLELSAGIKQNPIDNFIERSISNQYFKDEIVYLKLLILFTQKKYKEVVDYININLLTSDCYLALKSWSNYCLKKYKKEYSFEISRNYHQVFMNFLNKLHYLDNHEVDARDAVDMLKPFMKDEEFYNHILYNRFIFQKYVEYLSKTTSYKETCSFLKKNIDVKR